MNRVTLKVIAVLLFLFVGEVSTARAAYIDPNTGGMLFQVLAVMFGVISGAILLFSSRIKMLYFRIMRSLRGSKPESELESDDLVD